MQLAQRTLQYLHDSSMNFPFQSSPNPKILIFTFLLKAYNNKNNSKVLTYLYLVSHKKDIDK